MDAILFLLSIDPRVGLRETKMIVDAITANT
jgi:hypothetical protein